MYYTAWHRLGGRWILLYARCRLHEQHSHGGYNNVAHANTRSLVYRTSDKVSKRSIGEVTKVTKGRTLVAMTVVYGSGMCEAISNYKSYFVLSVEGLPARVLTHRQNSRRVMIKQLLYYSRSHDMHTNGLLAPDLRSSGGCNTDSREHATDCSFPP